MEKNFMALNNFIKAACLSTCLGLASGSALANVATNGGLEVYDTNDSDHFFKLTGKMQLDQNIFHLGSKNISSSLDLRAVQAKVEGGVGKDLSYSFRLKRDGNSVVMDQSQVTYSGFNSWSKVSVGQVSMPYGLQTGFTEDALATGMFRPNASKEALGMSLTAWNDKVGLTCSVHQPSSNALTSVANLDTAARLSFAPLMRENLVLHLGANAYMQKNSGSFSYSLANNSEDSMELVLDAGASKRGFCIDAAVSRGPLFLQAELHQVSVGKEQQAKGYNVEASYALTGETRQYDKVKGSFSGLKTERDGGSWQVSARHSAVHMDKSIKRTVGASVAWTVNNNLTVLANYENAISENYLGALSLRLQAAW
jgi:phosphate-selective porin